MTAQAIQPKEYAPVISKMPDTISPPSDIPACSGVCVMPLIILKFFVPKVALIKSGADTVPTPAANEYRIIYT